MSETDSTERWLPVVGYEGFYEVSDAGNVRSLPRTDAIGRARPAHLHKRRIDSFGVGYAYVNLCTHSKAKKVNVHVLVLEAFVGPRPSARHEACHGDGDRTNPALNNLRWDTAQANHTDRLIHGTHCRGAQSPLAILSVEMVRWIRESPQSSLKLAPLLGVASSTIRAVRIGQNWSHLS